CAETSSGSAMACAAARQNRKGKNRRIRRFMVQREQVCQQPVLMIQAASIVDIRLLFPSVRQKKGRALY
ncbi:hypothetical protein, partial [Thiolapillus sp.]|uniref:hypothetical protein n=1 Tax=Thiolapillus sp. TaxID=2017437 RepID=UPI003AF77EC1